MRREPEAHEALSKTLATDQASASPSQDTQISRPQEPVRRAYEELALPARASSFLLLFVGLVYVVPILAHASWHLYRKVVV